VTFGSSSGKTAIISSASITNRKSLRGSGAGCGGSGGVAGRFGKPRQLSKAGRPAAMRPLPQRPLGGAQLSITLNPASAILTRITSTGLFPAIITARSEAASPTRTSTASILRLKPWPWTSISSFTPWRLLASSSSARRRSALSGRLAGRLDWQVAAAARR